MVQRMKVLEPTYELPRSLPKPARGISLHRSHIFLCLLVTIGAATQGNYKMSPWSSSHSGQDPESRPGFKFGQKY